MDVVGWTAGSVVVDGVSDVMDAVSEDALRLDETVGWLTAVGRDVVGVVLDVIMLVVLMVAGWLDAVSELDVSVAGSMGGPTVVVNEEATSVDGGPVVPVSKDPKTCQ